MNDNNKPRGGMKPRTRKIIKWLWIAFAAGTVAMFGFSHLSTTV